MKVLFTIFSALFTLIGLQTSAQTCQGGSGNCTVTAENIQAVATAITPTPGGCQIKLNVQFDITNNGGFKFINMYFFNGATPAAICGGAEPTSTNAPNLGAYLVLRANTPPAYSIVTAPKNGINPQTGYTFTTTTIPTGIRVSLQGFTFTKTGNCSTTPLSIHIGGSNANSNGIQCYASYSFIAYQLLLRGVIGCSGPRNYNVTFSTDYNAGGPTLQPISGNYDVLIDLDRSGTINSGDITLSSNVPFTSTVSGSTNNYVSGVTNYGSDFVGGDPRSDKNLLFRIRPSTSGVAGLDGVVLNPCAPLPVSIKSFTAKLNGDKVMLNWETADEINNKGFEIQRRVMNGNSYEKIAFVDAKAANGLGASYNFADAAKFKGSVAYRIVQQDLDGKLTYSDIRVVNIGSGKSQMIVYPNPSKGSMRVSLPMQSGKADISLEDFAGKTIQRWNSYNANTLQLDQIRPGIYLIRVRLQDTGEQMIERLIVQ